MTPQQFFRKGIDHGDKVEVVLQEPEYYSKPRKVKEVLFFRGFRILAGQSVTNAMSDLVPVFVRPTKKDGTMGRKHYGYEKDEIPTWWENIKSVKILERPLWKQKQNSN